MVCNARDRFATAAPGSEFEVGFSPYGHALEVVLDRIASARKSILVAAYSFTSKPIASALLDAHRHGIKVFVVADEKDNAKKSSAVRFLANAGVPVRLNAHYAIHHHKFMVIDEVSVETGSFNYSAAAANKNAENALFLRNVKPLAAQYADEWKRLWNESQDLVRAY